MGIINATPDSFYGGSRFTNEAAIARAFNMVNDGAMIIDVGGESTRPGSEPITIDEELRRVIPIIKGLASRINASISIDTYKPEVAEKALDAGATIINDITGMANPMMRALAAKRGAEVVIMHMQGTPKTMQENPTYENIVTELEYFFIERILACENDGIEPEKIILDPGIGFGKTTMHNIEILKNINAFKSLGKRVMVGASRKSFIGKLLGSESQPLAPEDRLEGSLAIASYCALNGVDILRVHDVKETVRAITVAQAVGI